MISLITMGAGNVKVLGKTLKSFKNVFDEVIYGDILIFPEDRRQIIDYGLHYNMKCVKYPFNYIFKYGFSHILNDLASKAANDYVLYMNTSEIIDDDYGIVDIVNSNQQCNSFYFIHRTDPHRWFRLYNKNDLKWSGVIHEQLAGEYKPYHKPVFMMADLEKDMDDPRKASILNSVKEIVYFNNYLKIADGDRKCLGETDPGWVKFAHDNRNNMYDRMVANGDLYEAFEIGDTILLEKAIINYNKHINFESSTLIEYQGDPKFLNKKNEV